MAEVVQNASGPLLVEIDKLPGNPLGITLAQGRYRGRTVLFIDSVTPASIADRSVHQHHGSNIPRQIDDDRSGASYVGRITGPKFMSVF